ncbi:hypothetical protein KGQ34_01025 [Patescibacteria group bacterium]|nr:hypothetical protein [Patescibacteria group bacterium]
MQTLNNWKVWLLLGLMIVSGVANGYLWSGIFSAGSLGNYYIFSLPVIGLILFAICFSLASIFIERRVMLYPAALITVIAQYFFIKSTGVALGGLGVTLLLYWFAILQIKNEVAVSLSFSLRKYLRSGLPIFFTASALMFSVFYFTLSLHSANDYISSLVPKGLFAASLSILQNPIQGLIPGFNPNLTIDEILMSAVQSQAGGKINVTALPPQEKKAILRQGYDQIEKQFGIRVSGKEKGIDVLYRLANQKIGEFAGPYKQYIPFVAAFGVFLTVKILAWPLYWTTILLSFILVKALVAARFFKREKTQIEVERLSL